MEPVAKRYGDEKAVRAGTILFMNEVTLGKIITGSPPRDAIHIAVAPVVAAHVLKPGERIGFLPDGTVGLGNPDRSTIGVVDPFLDKAVEAGHRFWMLLYPNTITALRHEWTHPAFALEIAATAARSSAEQWLRDFADRHDFTYSQVLQAGSEYVADGGYFVQRGAESARDEMYDPTTRHRFWECFAAVTGTAISDEDREGTVFSCSC